MKTDIFFRVHRARIFASASCALLLLCGPLLLAQQLSNKGQEMKRSYPDEAFARLTVTETYSFKLEDQPHASRQRIEVLESLKNDREYLFSETFDEFSTINLLRVQNEKKKTLKLDTRTTNFEQDGIFHDDSKISWNEIPMGKAGSQITCTSVKEFLDLRYLTGSYFHGSLPIGSKQIIFSIPDWLDLEIMEMNFEGYDISKMEGRQGKNRLLTYTMTDLRGLDLGANAPGPSHFLPHLLIIFRGYQGKDAWQHMFERTDDLYAWYRSLIEQAAGSEAEVAELSARLTRDKETDLDKAKAIFSWVQSNIRYVAFEDGLAGFIPKDPAQVINRRYGDCKGMAYLTSRLLQSAGLDARPAWIGTHRIAYDYSIPSLAVDNHMITCLMMDGQTLFLDPTEKYLAFGEYGARIQGRPVMIYAGEDYILEHIPDFDRYYNRIEERTELHLEGDLLVGHNSMTHYGGAKSNVLAVVDAVRSEDIEDVLTNYCSRGNSNFIVREMKYDPLSPEADSIELEQDFEIRNAASSFQGEIYLDLHFRNWFEGSDISEDRQLPIAFSSKFYQHYRLIFDVPEGYRVSSFPPSLDVDQEGFSFSANYEIRGEKLVLEQSWSLKELILEPGDFEAWNEAIGQLGDFYSEQIVLTAK